MTAINLNLLYVKGRSDLSLKLDLIKKPIGIVILFASLPFGLWWMCFGKAFYDFVAFAMNCYYTKKLLDYGFIEQLKSIASILIVSILMYIVISGICSFFTSYIMMLIVGTFTGLSFYCGVFALMKDDVIRMSFKKIKSII